MNEEKLEKHGLTEENFTTEELHKIGRALSFFYDSFEAEEFEVSRNLRMRATRIMREVFSDMDKPFEVSGA